MGRRPSVLTSVSQALAPQGPKTRSRSAEQKVCAEIQPELEKGPLTRSRVRNVASQLLGTFKSSAIKIGCLLHPLVKDALDRELERELEGVGDLDPGEELSCISEDDAQNSLDDNVPSTATDVSLPASTAAISAGPRAPISRKAGTAAIRRLRRKARLEEKFENDGEVPFYRMRSSTSQAQQEFRCLKNNFAVSKLPVARNAWIGVRHARETDLKTVEELKAAGFEYAAWTADDTVVLVDDDDRIVGLLLRRPNDPTYLKHLKEFERVTTRAGEALKFKDVPHRRGNYRTIAVGVSHGGGQVSPGNLKHSEHNMKILDDLVKNDAVKRMAHPALAQFAPKLYLEYHTQLGKLFKKYPALRRLFPNSVFAAASFNFGPHAVTRSHADHGNRAIGWCAILAAGDYDPTRGGHIVLESFKLIIEFPPGAIVLIPSATCVHSNTPIQEHETRLAFTQYAAGGLFRFVDYEFRTWKKIVATDHKTVKRVIEERAGRLEKELGLYSHVNSLHADRVACGIVR
ncbi:hypothetical protein EIP86_011001 [Pleurotus ostreatoroseus]|nr:hypothetical protein EIP86_011001 [Pleurotus ostreatoroseus]